MRQCKTLKLHVKQHIANLKQIQKLIDTLHGSGNISRERFIVETHGTADTRILSKTLCWSNLAQSRLTIGRVETS